MKIFISLNISGQEELLLHEKLVSELKRLGVSVSTNVDLKKGNLEGSHFESLDALILEGTATEADTGYLLAIALAHKKPVLYLLSRGTLIDPSVDALSKNKDVKKYIKIGFFTHENLAAKVKGFLQYLDENIGKELHSIKYTLRLSPRLDRYITWKAAKVKKNKADFIRDSATEMMQKDEEYLKRLQ